MVYWCVRRAGVGGKAVLQESLIPFTVHWPHSSFFWKRDPQHSAALLGRDDDMQQNQLATFVSYVFLPSNCVLHVFAQALSNHMSQFFFLFLQTSHSNICAALWKVDTITKWVKSQNLHVYCSLWHKKIQNTCHLNQSHF